MKAKVTVPSRGKSNPPFKNLPPSTLLEEQTKKMEQRLEELKEVMKQQSEKRQNLDSGDGTRWQSANRNMPIKSYGKVISETHQKALSSMKSTKDNFGSTQTRQSREKASREKLAPISNPLLSTAPTAISQKNKENEARKESTRETLITGMPSNLTTPTNSTRQAAKPVRATKPPVEEQRTAENNIKKALASQKEEADEVEKFLNDAGLPQYIGVFKENGFDDLETIMEIQTKHMVDMKIPAGHQIKLSKRIEQFSQKKQNSQNTIIPTPAKTSTTSTDGINMSQLRSNTLTGQEEPSYVQLPEPTREQGIGDDKNGGELLRGNFDEAESHKSFLEALNEWRSGNKAKPVEVEKKESRAKDSRSKKVRFAEPTKEEQNDDGIDYISSRGPKKVEEKKTEQKEEKKSFFMQGGGSWNTESIPGQKESGTDMSPREKQALKVAKTSCWHCYRLVPEEDVQKVVNKQFCSKECVNAYGGLNSTKCVKHGCGKHFLKEEGLMIEGKWFCSEKCAPSVEEILMEEQRLLKKLEKEGLNVSGSYGHSNRSKDNEENLEEDEDVGGEDDDGVGFELSVDIGTKKEVLTLAELEEKYKNLNQVASKTQGGEDELEDSLN